MKIIIPQALYDQIGRRLTQHHKGHKGISDFPALIASLERNARITADGVEVDLARLKIVADAIQDNIRFAAGRYATAPDQMLLLDIADAVAEHEANLASPVPEDRPEGASATPEHQPVQSLQQPEPTDVVEVEIAPVKPRSMPVVIPENLSEDWTLTEPVQGQPTGRPSIWGDGYEERYRWLNQGGRLAEGLTRYKGSTRPSS